MFSAPAGPHYIVVLVLKSNRSFYEILEENKDAFHARFRDHAARIMRRCGFHIIAMWEAQTQKRTEFVFLLGWPNEQTKTDAWAAFMADQEWVEIKRITRGNGSLVGEIEDRLLIPTDYSPDIPMKGRPTGQPS